MKCNHTRKSIGSLAFATIVSFCVILTTDHIHAAGWQTLQEDNLHDPEAPALEVLQQPEEALSVLPPDTAGNKVDWVRALREGYIEPRSYLREKKTLEILDSDVLMKGTGDSLYVLFPHKAHTEWLECSNCHEKLFKSKAGETPITMLAILQGEYCGRCHGAVSFPLTECKRCHSVPQGSLTKTSK
jgi:c(7)-type cytochrome triheme protein